MWSHKIEASHSLQENWMQVFINTDPERLSNETARQSRGQGWELEDQIKNACQRAKLSFFFCPFQGPTLGPHPPTLGPRHLSLSSSTPAEKPDVHFLEPLESNRPTNLTCCLSLVSHEGQPLVSSWVGMPLTPWTQRPSIPRCSPSPGGPRTKAPTSHVRWNSKELRWPWREPSSSMSPVSVEGLLGPWGQWWAKLSISSAQLLMYRHPDIACSDKWRIVGLKTERPQWNALTY